MILSLSEAASNSFLNVKKKLFSWTLVYIANRVVRLSFTLYNTFPTSIAL